MNRYEKAQHELQVVESYLYDFSARWYKSLIKQMDIYDKDLALSDPNLKLKQGYSITFNKDRKVIKSTSLVTVHDTVRIKLHRGELVTRIESIK